MLFTYDIYDKRKFILIYIYIYVFTNDSYLLIIPFYTYNKQALNLYKTIKILQFIIILKKNKIFIK